MPETTYHPNAATEGELEELAERLAAAMLKGAPPDPPFIRAAQESERWARERYEASIELLRQHREGDGLRELLTSLEWSGESIIDLADGRTRLRVKSCPACGGKNPADSSLTTWWPMPLQWGHDPDCALKAAVEGRGESDGEDDPGKMAASFTVHFDTSTLTGRLAELMDSLTGPDAKLRVMRSESGDAWEREIVELPERLEKSEAHAAALADRVMVVEGERDAINSRYQKVVKRIARLRAQIPEWQEAVDEASAEAQNYHRLYAEQIGENAHLESRLADYDHRAEQAETYRLLYAETLAELDAAKGGKRPGTEPAAEVAWADWSKLRPGDEGYLPLNPGSDRPGNAGRACGAVYPHTPDGQHLQCTRAHDHEDDKHVAHGIDKDGNDYQIVAWREVQHGE